MLRNVHIWLGSYLIHHLRKRTQNWCDKPGPYHILFTICDHFEPFWNRTDELTAENRTKKWLLHYPLIASKHKDCLGTPPQYIFYYPIEEYRKTLLDMVGEICHNGFGETEVHLHHDNDTSDNLRNTLAEYKEYLSKTHGLLCRNKFTQEINYGFIHGNWALDNSRPDGRYCGVNNEITILQETGCYADFTMPSAPCITQTRTINRIYYAVDDPEKPKSHNSGIRATAGVKNREGLLCIQGPLGLNLKSRKLGLFPRIENGNLAQDIKISPDRIKIWIDQHIHVKGRPDIIFIKLYTHGTQEATMDYFFDQGALDYLYTFLENFCAKSGLYRLYYVSSRQMYNVVKGLEATPDAKPEYLFDYELVKAF